MSATTSLAARNLLHNQLMAAVIGGDIEVVESLLAQQGVNVNVLGMMDRIPLHWAAFFGHTEIVCVLLAQSDIDLNAFDSVRIHFSRPLTHHSICLWK